MALKAGSGRIKDKKTVQVNLAGVEASQRRKKVVPEGNYKAKVDAVEAKTFKSGNDGVEWVFVISEGPEKGVKFWYNTMLQEQSLWSFRGVLEALTPKPKLKDSAMNIPLDKLVGRQVALEIVDGEYDGKPRSEINDVFSIELLDEDDVDEEDEDEEEADELDDLDDEEDEEEDEEDEDEIDLDDDEL